MQKKYGVYGDRLSFTEFTCRSVFPVTSWHIQFMAGTSGVAA